MKKNLKKDYKDLKSPIKFYNSMPNRPFTGFDELSKLVCNGTMTVYIKTPKNWKCKRKGCTTDFKHIHSTYNGLLKNK